MSNPFNGQWTGPTTIIFWVRLLITSAIVVAFSALRRHILRIRFREFFFPIWFGIAPDPAKMNIFDPPRRFCLIVWPLRLWRNILIIWLTGKIYGKRSIIWFGATFFPVTLIEAIVDDKMTKTEYVWRQGPYSIGVDVAAGGDWSAAVLIKEHRDGTLEVIGEKRWKSGTPASEMADPFPGAIWTCMLCGAEGTGPRMFCPICYYPCCGECRDQHFNEFHSRGAGLHTTEGK